MREEQDDNISVEDMDREENDRDSETLLEIAIRCMINS